MTALVDPSRLRLVEQTCPRCEATTTGLWVNVPPTGESMCDACHKIELARTSGLATTSVGTTDSEPTKEMNHHG